MLANPVTFPPGREMFFIKPPKKRSAADGRNDRDRSGYGRSGAHDDSALGHDHIDALVDQRNGKF
jgi:hypothetical protein